METYHLIRVLRFITVIFTATTMPTVGLSFAAELPQGFSYQGRLLNEAGTAPLTGVVSLIFGIYSPDGQCLLYEETQGGIDLTISEGEFSVAVGSPLGDPKRTSKDPGLSMSLLFANSGSELRSVEPITCSNGYTPASYDERNLRVTVNFSQGASVTLAPDQRIGMTPLTLVAQTLQGLSPVNFIQTSQTGTQAAFEVLTAGIQSDASSLHHHDSLYLKASSSSTQHFGSGGIASSGGITSNSAFTVSNSSAARAGSNVSSPAINISGNYWNGATSSSDTWSIQNILEPSVTNPASILQFSHSGSAGGASYSFLNGNVGVGTIAQHSSLEIKGQSGITFDVTGGSPHQSNWRIGGQVLVDGGFEITPSTTVGTFTFLRPALVVKSDNKVGIDTQVPDATLDVNGTFKWQDVRYYRVNRNVGPNIGDWAEIGSFANGGVSQYAEFTVKGHWCGSIISAKFRFDSTTYNAGGEGSTQWIELPVVEGGKVWGGSGQALAVDVKRSNLLDTADPILVRIRSTYLNCNSPSPMINIITNTSFTETFGTGSGGTVDPGFMGSNVGWKFPAVSSGWSATQQGLFINPNGKVGIGTTAPTVSLDVMGNMKMHGIDQGSEYGWPHLFMRDSSFWFGVKTGSPFGVTDPMIINTNSARSIVFSRGATATDTGISGGTASLIIDSGGNVGIGTTNPGRGSTDVPKIDISASQLKGDAVTLGNRHTAWFGSLDPSGPLVLSINLGNNPMATSRYMGLDVSEVGIAPRNLVLQSSGGNVGIGTTDPNAKLDVNGTIDGNYQGFSYKAVGATVAAGWGTFIIDILDYNSFGPATYNTGSGTFTAPKNGYYRFSLSGWASANTVSNDRFAMGVYVNGSLRSFGGGQFSSSDSPIGSYSHVVYLAAGSTVKPAFYNSLGSPITLGHGSTGHEFWFQGEFVGK